MLGLIKSGNSWKDMVGQRRGGKCRKLGSTLQGLFIWILLDVPLKGRQDGLFPPYKEAASQMREGSRKRQVTFMLLPFPHTPSA